MEHGHLSAVEAAQHAALDVQLPMRGEIVDAQGNPLATDVSESLVYAAPKEIRDPARTAALLAPVLHLPQKTIRDLVTGYSPWVPLSAAVDERTSQEVRNLALPGIILDPIVKRDYPEGETASQVLGFANADNHGQYGLEQYYDQLLSGKAGWRSVLRDTAGNDIRVGSRLDTPAHKGADLHLSINGTVQGLVEDELQKAVKQHHADGGTVIVMNPRTGFILGMASLPSFDPNHYSRVTDQHRYFNPATYNLYEPGSTFKIVTMAAGLDTHVITPQSTLYDTGQFTIAGVTLHNWNMSGFGLENMTQVLQHSANVGAAWVSQRLGTALFYKYVKAFRFGQPTGIDLVPESPGILPLPGDKTWTVVNQYTNAFGQGLAVTPIQLLRAVATVANGGVMMKPQIVKRIVYDGHIIDRPPVSQGRVVSPQTAHTLTNMLVHSAIGGEASLGLVKGYNVAAKTGTANVAGPNGQYIPGDTIASIVGYAPAFHPQFAVLVKIDHPRDTPWGSMAAAPVLKDLLQELFMYYRVPPNPHAINQ
jgi:cell division protein FtsI/penicillin-binding protein 2